MTVMETDEEDTDAVTRGLHGMHLAAPSPPNLSRFADEPEDEEQPVVVNEAPDDESMARPTETIEADDTPEEANEAGAKSATSEQPKAGSAVVENNAKVTEPAAEEPSTTPAAPDTPLSPVPLIEAEPAKESAISTDRDGPATGHSDTDALDRQETEATSEAADSAKPIASGDNETPAASSATATAPSATVTSTEETLKENQ